MKKQYVKPVVMKRENLTALVAGKEIVSGGGD